jgi:hypothetical protein
MSNPRGHAERKARHEGPVIEMSAWYGRILLANLDVDRTLAGQPSDRPVLDGENEEIDGQRDREVVRVPLPKILGGPRLLRIAQTDVPLLRFFAPDGNGSWRPVLGGSAGAAVTTNASELRAEALALPGPAARALTVARERGLVRARLFTIAPFMLLSNLQPVDRVYVNYWDDAGGQGNYATVHDLVDVLSDIYGGDAVPVQKVGGGTGYDSHDHDGDVGRLYIVTEDDPWVQDEFEIGYCCAPQGALHIVLHNPRHGNLSRWVTERLAGPDVGLYEKLAGFPVDQVDFGGNLEVSAPVRTSTLAMVRGLGGPEVPAQGPAPFGKILLGEGRLPLFTLPPERRAQLVDGRVPVWLERAFSAVSIRLSADSTVTVIRGSEEWRVEDPAGDSLRRPDRIFQIVAEGAGLAVYFRRTVTPEYRNFLESQRVQPILPLDTSWLNAGHVDEVLSLVPAPARDEPKSASKEFCMAVASSALAVDLLVRAQRKSQDGRPLTRMFRGVAWTDSSGGPGGLIGLSVDAALNDYCTGNRTLQDLRLTPLEQRLIDGLGLRDDQIKRLPVLYYTTGTLSADLLGVIIGDDMPLRTTAYTPALVNMLVVGDHVVLPRPMGPRMATTDVQEIIQDLGVVPAFTVDPTGHWHWAPSSTTLSELAEAFGLTEQDLKSHPRNKDKADQLQLGWTRIWIPEKTVDLFEAYASSVLTGLGLTVHFIDDWNGYHLNEGEVHCATNAQRSPAENSSMQWWKQPIP